MKQTARNRKRYALILPTQSGVASSRGLRPPAHVDVLTSVRYARSSTPSSTLVGGLPERRLGQIAPNLNFDVLGSPSFARFVYDGDGSTIPDDPDDAGPADSAKIEWVFEHYYAAKGLATTPTAFDGRSDHGPFIAVGIPAGGMFTRTEGIKTEHQAET